MANLIFIIFDYQVELAFGLIIQFIICINANIYFLNIILLNLILQ